MLAKKRKNQSVLKMLTATAKILKSNETSLAVTPPPPASSDTLASISDFSLQVQAQVYTPEIPNMAERNGLVPIYSADVGHKFRQGGFHRRYCTAGTLSMLPETESDTNHNQL